MKERREQSSNWLRRHVRRHLGVEHWRELQEGTSKRANTMDFWARWGPVFTSTEAFNSLDDVNNLCDWDGVKEGEHRLQERGRSLPGTTAPTEDKKTVMETKFTDKSIQELFGYTRADTWKKVLDLSRLIGTRDDDEEDTRLDEEIQRLKNDDQLFTPQQAFNHLLDFAPDSYQPSDRLRKGAVRAEAHAKKLKGNTDDVE